MSINSTDPAEIASRVLGGASMFGGSARGVAKRARLRGVQ